MNIDDINNLKFEEDSSLSYLARNDRLDLNEDQYNYTFTFLNKKNKFTHSIDWSPKGKTKLWIYNLHYFEYLFDLAHYYKVQNNNESYLRYRKIVSDWCINNQFGSSIGWDPYPTSIRIVNWIISFHYFRDCIDNDLEFKSLFIKSIYKQTLVLRKNIENHLFNNHIIENGKALFLAGCFFNNKTAIKWKLKGEKILIKCLDYQILDDGAQYELSPMYHTITMINYIQIFNIYKILRQKAPYDLDHKLVLMINYFFNYCIINNDYALFNDAAKGMAPDIKSVKNYLKYNNFSHTENFVMEIPENYYKNSGYYTLQSTDESKCIIDCGPLGPKFQPGHGHCDSLSYIWSYNGEDIIIDSGSSDYYGNKKFRYYTRSTRAHNTIEIDDTEQSEIWSRFRFGRQAQSNPIHYDKINNNIQYFIGSHNGYNRLDKNLKYFRTIIMVESNILIVYDKVVAINNHVIKSYLHIHPKYQFLNDIDNNSIFSSQTTKLNVISFGDIIKTSHYKGSLDPIQGWYIPEFGKKKKNNTIEYLSEKKPIINIGYCLIGGKTNEEDINLNYKVNNNGIDLLLTTNDKRYKIFLMGETVKFK